MKKLLLLTITILSTITMTNCSDNPMTVAPSKTDTLYTELDTIKYKSDTTQTQTVVEEILDTIYESYADSFVVHISSNINDTTFIYVNKTYSHTKDHDYKKYYYIADNSIDSTTYYSTATDSVYTRTSAICNVMTYDVYNYYETGELKRIILDIDKFYVYYDIDGNITKVIENGSLVVLSNDEIASKIKEYEIESF